MIFLQQAPPLLAAVGGLVEGNRLVSYRLARLEQFDDARVVVAVLGLVCLAAVVYVAWQYRRETASLSTAAATLLATLRIVALGGLVVYYLQPVKRTDVEVVTDSRVVVLADVSQSMAITDTPGGDGQPTNRAQSIVEALSATPLLTKLRSEHDVALITFDDQVRRVAAWRRTREATADSPEQTTSETANPATNWGELLNPLGPETRLGDALAEALSSPAEGRLAGVVVFSDGGQNSGVDPLTVADLAAEERTPIYAVGIGSTEPRKNVRVQEVVAPSRAYPGDRTVVRAVIQGEGFAGRPATVELHSQLIEGDATAPATQIGAETVEFASDDDVQTVEFAIEPAEVGRLGLEVRVVAGNDDQHAGDNRRSVELEVVEANTKVLLIASGATREYRFLRNLLRRDDHTTVDVWLQNAQPGISQDANAILDQFPTTKEALYQYDGIIAFDPDWLLFDSLQVELLTDWVAEEAGGLIVIAGPVHTAAWVQSPEHAKIRSLYPVEFQKRLTLLDDGQYGSRVPWPIDFTRAGKEATFLMLGDSTTESRAAWEDFAGVYGCYAVKGPKPGAQVYGRYSDPDAGLSVERPVYMAEHFFGAGRVFYLGSGEMWRLRGVDPGYFEVLYTQLVRHVTQGRLLRGSTRGMLLLEREQVRVGDDAVVRAQLSTPAQEPYLAERVTLRVTRPSGEGQNVALDADPTRPGNYIGDFAVLEEGAYRLELPVPDAIDQQLTRRLSATIPDLEFERTQRDEQLLAALAQRSGGRYYASPRLAALGGETTRSIGDLLQSQVETKIVEGTDDPDFTRQLHYGLLAVICSALFCEWLMRRLWKLA